jgi:hypothetical protein
MIWYTDLNGGENVDNGLKLAIAVRIMSTKARIMLKMAWRMNND